MRGHDQSPSRNDPSYVVDPGASALETVVILIGNSDDRLSQGDWSDYQHSCGEVIHGYAEECHFQGHSAGNAPWQNAAWVIAITRINMTLLWQSLDVVRRRKDQSSIAWVRGQTRFISGVGCYP